MFCNSIHIDNYNGKKGTMWWELLSLTECLLYFDIYNINGFRYFKYYDKCFTVGYIFITQIKKEDNVIFFIPSILITVGTILITVNAIIPISGKNYLILSLIFMKSISLMELFLWVQKEDMQVDRTVSVFI